MEYVTLDNGVRMPLVGLGTWDLRGKDCEKSVSNAIHMGYSLIDTAQMYENETEVGNGIKMSGVKREDVFVTTKIFRISNSYEKAVKAIDISLQRLGLEYVDLLLLHEPYAEGTEMYRALEEALEAGKTRAIGISNYNETWYQNFIKSVNVIPAVNQLETHVYYQKWEFQEEMKKHGTLLQAWSPQAQGKDNLAQHPLLVEIGAKYGKTAAQIALRFLVQRGISIIPKSRNENRQRENLSLFDFSLSESDMDQIKT